MTRRRTCVVSFRQSRRSLTSLLKIVLSIGLLAIVLRQVGWQETWQTLRSARWPYLVVAFGLAILNIIVRAYRWKILADALGMHISLARLTSLYFVGTFFSDFLPTGVGGDVVRAYEVAQVSENGAAAVGTVLVDRATGLLALFLMASFSLLFSHRLVSLQIVLVILLLTAVSWGGSIFFMRRDWLERLKLLHLLGKVRQLEEVYQSVYACGARAIGGALGISLAVNVLLIAMNYLVALSLGVRLSLGYFLLFVPIISFLLVLPVSLSGWGVREGGYVYLFSQAGVAAPVAFAMSLIIQTFQLGIGLVGAAIYTLEGMHGFRAQFRKHGPSARVE